jgi:predicted nucleic acid-binding protein
VLRVTADTNLYISALNFGGKPEQLLRLAKAGIIQLVISDAILAEMCTVLRGEKFAWPELEILKAQQEIEDMSEGCSQPKRFLSSRKTPPTTAFWSAPQQERWITSSPAINTF